MNPDESQFSRRFSIKKFWIGFYNFHILKLKKWRRKLINVENKTLGGTYGLIKSGKFWKAKTKLVLQSGERHSCQLIAANVILKKIQENSRLGRLMCVHKDRNLSTHRVERFDFWSDFGNHVDLWTFRFSLKTNIYKNLWSDTVSDFSIPSTKINP